MTAAADYLGMLIDQRNQETAERLAALHDAATWRDPSPRAAQRRAAARALKRRLARQRRWDELAAEVNHLAGTDTVAGIAGRLAYSSHEGLCRSLRRAGHAETAMRVEALARRERLS